MFYKSLFNLVGEYGGVTKSELTKEVYRTSFSKFLPWHSYDEESNIYYNNDDTIGILFECIPHNFSGEKTFDTLEGILRQGLPDNSVIQFNIFGDNYIDPITNHYQAKTKRQIDVLLSSKSRLVDFLKKSSIDGLEDINDIPVRNFRLMVAIKVPIEALKKRGFNVKRVRKGVLELLSGTNLHPYEMKPEDLIFWARRFFNGEAINDNYNEKIPINKQVILADRKVKTSFRKVKINDQVFKCITPKVYPENIDSLKMNQVLGGIWGLRDDNSQILSPFMVSVSLIVEDLKGKIHRKFTLLSGQGKDQKSKEQSFASGIQKRKSEYAWAVDLLDENTQFTNIMTTIWVWGKDEDRVDESVNRLKRLWENEGFTMQNDAGILKILFISSLPFGLYLFKNNLDNIQRSYTAPVPTAVACLPTQADFMGNGDPALLFIGRKGQLIAIDVTNENATNKNGFIVAGTGKGKSFLCNYLVSNYYANGTIIRIVDLGYSYKKITKVFGGKFLEFDAYSKICINPFGQINTEDTEETEIGIGITAEVIGSMAISAAKKLHESSNNVPQLDATDGNILMGAVRRVFSDYGPEGDIDHVIKVLSNYSKMIMTGDSTQSFKDRIQTKGEFLAFNLNEFGKKGMYGKWFNGKSNLNITDEPFVVLELEQLKPQTQLFPIVTTQIVNAINRDLYLSDRSNIRFNIFDEAHQFMKEGEIIGKSIEDGYRRARKYSGAFWTITQSIMDLAGFGETGRIIQSQSAYKFYLKSDDISKADKKGVIDTNELTLELMKSANTMPGRYSEVFFDTEVGTGIGRLVIDKYNYYLYTSKSEEVSEMDQMVKAGLSWDEAINKMIQKYGS